MMSRAEKKSQKIFEKQLIHRCDVFQKKRMRVGALWQEVYIEVENLVKCRMSTPGASDSERNTENQQKFTNKYTLYSLPINIAQDYRVLLYTKRNEQWVEGNFYEVKAIPRNPSFKNHHYETPCEIMNTHYEIIEENGVRRLGN